MVRIHKVGWLPTGLCVLVTVGLFLLTPWLALPGFAVTVLCALFFRDPERVIPAGEGLVLAAADGKVMCVDEAPPPAELGLPDQPVPRVATFLDLDDVHVNRVPASGEVIQKAVRDGGFVRAWQPHAAEQNVRRSTVIKTADGRLFVVVQIVGFIARRIVSDLSPGDEVTIGQRFGIIAFGSRVDIYLPEGAEPLVAVGERMVAGETVIAKSLPDDRHAQQII